MPDICRRNGTCLSFENSVYQTLPLPYSSRCYHRNMDCFNHARCQTQIVPLLGTVLINRGKKNLPCPQLFRFLCPCDRVQTRWLFAVCNKHFVGSVHLLCINRDNN